jgi:hypothetical protein
MNINTLEDCEEEKSRYNIKEDIKKVIPYQNEDQEDGIDIIDISVNEDKRLAMEASLWYWNLSCCILHFIQAIICLAGGLAKGTKAADFKLPLTTLFLSWEESYPGGPRYPVQTLVQRALLPFTAVTSGFSWLSFAAHLVVLIYYKKYIKDLRNGINQFRWFEYALSSSLMIGLIAMLFGMYDIISLVLIMSINACMNFFGYNMENNSILDTRKVDWISFYFGSFAGYYYYYYYCKQISSLIFIYIRSSPLVLYICIYRWRFR